MVMPLVSKMNILHWLLGLFFFLFFLCVGALRAANCSVSGQQGQSAAMNYSWRLHARIQVRPSAAASAAPRALWSYVNGAEKEGKERDSFCAKALAKGRVKKWNINEMVTNCKAFFLCFFNSSSFTLPLMAAVLFPHCRFSGCPRE